MILQVTEGILQFFLKQENKAEAVSVHRYLIPKHESIWSEGKKKNPMKLHKWAK